jgi:transcriptional regulator
MGTNKRVPPELPGGTVDLLILKALAGGKSHGYAIAQYIRALSDEVLVLGESSLYTALQRLLLNGWVTDEWGASENNRRARYYTLTPAGRKHLAAQTREFDLVVTAIQRVLRTA